MTAEVPRRWGPLRGPRLPRLVPRLEHGQRAELADHLGELRARLIVVLSFIVVAFGVAFAYHERLIGALNQALPDDVPKPVTLGVAEPFLTSIKISLWAAVAATMPVILWQAWGFFAPTVEKSQRRATLVFVLVGSLLFAAGVAFSYLVALPSAVAFLTSYDSSLYDIQVRAKDYYTFAAAVVVSVGLVFELPIVLLALVRLRIISAARLASNRRIAYVSLTALAVALPGVDPVLTLLELGPLVILFELTLVAAKLLERRWDSARDRAAADTG